MSSGPECLVIGGGVEGLAIAWAVAAAGASVRVLERGRLCGQEASSAAAGMLAEGAEATEPDQFFELCRRSRELWPHFAEELLRLTGVDCELEPSGLLRLTDSELGAERLRSQSERQRQQGTEVSGLLLRERLLQLAPGLGPSVLAGLHYPSDCHVHSHRVVEALIAACDRSGVLLETEVEVLGVGARGRRATVSLASGEELAADVAVVAAGSWTGQLVGEASRLGAEPVRGQMLALEPQRPLPQPIIFGDHGYALQKRSGLVLAGSTEESAGFSPWPTLEGVSSIAARALELLPELRGARFLRAWAGLRPRMGRGWPVLGRLEEGGPVLLASGHYRNGILLTPVTAELVSRAVLEGEDPEELRPFSPRLLA